MTDSVRISFGTDGIRGLAGQFPLDPATVMRLGRAIGVWLRRKLDGRGTGTVLIGRDTRISGGALLHALSAGLLSEGMAVLDAGVLTTPGVAYTVRAESIDLGIVVSASHNPYDHNGLKVFGPDGFKLPDEDERAIEALVNSGTFEQPSKSFGDYHPLSSAYSFDFSPYETGLIRGFEELPLDNLNVVLDCANGAASTIAPRVFRAVMSSSRAWVIARNHRPDGYNINVAAGSEVVRRDRAAMLEAIRATEADLGIAFDGDADRVVCVTPEGTLVDGDHVLGILALELKEQGRLPSNTVVATDMSNTGLEHYLRDHGIAMIRTKVGDRYVMDKLRQGDYLLGGEQAGHVILLDGESTCGDGIYVGLLIAALVSRNKRSGGPTLHDLATRIPRYPQVIASAQLATTTDLAKVKGLDGLKQQALAAFGGKGRVNMRFSGTEPNLLRVMVEGGPANTIHETTAWAKTLCAPVAEATKTASPTIDMVDCATGAPL